MALARYSQTVDGTIPVQALLYDEEDLLTSQSGVGIYDGNQKSALHQSGTVYITSHRLFFISSSATSFAAATSDEPDTESFYIDLSNVTRTDYYAGLFTSSPKITLYLSSNAHDSETSLEIGVSGLQVNGAAADTWATWECEVCGYRNPPGLSPAKAAVCGLCGVPRLMSSSSTSRSPASHGTSLSMSSAPSLVGTETSSSFTESGKPNVVSCQACTFDNDPSLRACVICGTPLPRPRLTSLTPKDVRSAPTSRPTSPSLGPDDNGMIKLSFRKGVDKAFYAVLKRSLQGKGWESKRNVGLSRSGTTSPAPGVGMSGINHILQTVRTSHETRQLDMTSALQDLDALMIRTKDMVNLAKDLCDQWQGVEEKRKALNLGETRENDESASFIQSSLSQLGLQMPNAPVSRDTVKDERKWLEELARELGVVLQGFEPGQGMMRQRGIVGLDEVWGGWNRARGVSLIPPNTFLEVLPHLSSYTSPPLVTRTFSSGLVVLHTPPYAHAAFASRLTSYIASSGPRTTLEVAQEEGLTVGLTAEMITDAEKEGEICRDAGDEGGPFGGHREIKWWHNIFREYTWDGQAD